LNNDYYWKAAEESFPTLIQVGGRKMEIGPRDRGGNRPARTAVHAHAAANWSGHHERSLGTLRANRRSYARELPNLASSSGGVPWHSTQCEYFTTDAIVQSNQSQTTH